MASGSCAGHEIIERDAASRCMITPATATEPHFMFLSALDILMRWFHYPLIVFFYKLEGPNAFERGVEVLKASLSRALVAYYPWAGRLVEQADGRLALHCNDAGVEFLEASTSLPFSSLQEDDFQNKDFFQDFCSLPHIFEWTGHDLPLLSIQVTKFPNGEAMVLSASCSHVVADGSSTTNFFKSWGECARGLAMSLPPIHIREELCLEKLIKPCVNKKGLSSAYGGKLGFKWPEPGVIAQHDFHFSSQTLVKLKHIATSRQMPCSTFQALVAHIWKHVALVEDLKDSNEYGLSIVGDFRMRLNPPLPEGYFGNVMGRSFTKSKIEDLKRESLGNSVKRVLDAIKLLDDESFKTHVGELELLPTCDLLKKINNDIPSLVISGSPKFPFYDVEFGWGKPSCVRSPRIRGCGEAFLWMGKEQDGSIDVSLALNSSTIERLKQDTSFLVV